MNCGIYGLRHKQNGKWYVGQSIDIRTRWFDYRRLDCENQHKIFNAIKKYGFDAFETILIEPLPPQKEVLNERETFWIKHHNSIENGYNIADGGIGGANFKGRKHTPETIEKMRLAKLGKKRGPMPEAQKQKIHQALVGRLIR